MNDTARNHEVKRRRTVSIRFFYALAAVLAAIIILLLCMTIFFNVTRIKVEGVTVYRKDQITAVGGLETEMNLVRTDVRKAEKRLIDNLVYIDDVKIKKAYPSTLVITCTEAEKAADIEFKGEYYVLSTSGKILESGNRYPTGGIPVVTGFEFFEGDKDDEDENGEIPEKTKRKYRQPGCVLRSADDYSAKILTDILSELKKQGYEKIRSIDITSRADIRINIDDRIDIRMGSSADTEYKLSSFKSVMDSLIEGYEGTLIYNGGDGGFSAIPKDKIITKPKFKDPDSSAADDNDDNTGGDTPYDGDDSSAAEPAMADIPDGDAAGGQQDTQPQWEAPQDNYGDYNDYGGQDYGYYDNNTDGNDYNYGQEQTYDNYDYNYEWGQQEANDWDNGYYDYGYTEY